MTLFGFGTATVDLRITTADLGSDYRAKLLARETQSFGGGAAANALHQASLLGARTEWLGRLGRDTLGQIIAADLEAHGVGTTHVVRADGALSPFNVAVYAGPGHRRVGGFLLPNCLADITEADLSAWTGAIAPGDWCLVEVGEIPLPIVLEFCRLATEVGEAHLVLDLDLDPIRQCVGGSRGIVTELMRRCDFVLPNRDAMSTLYPGLSAGDLTRAVFADCGRPVVTTSGGEGCCYANPDGLVVVPAHHVDVVDAVGAGDAFHGGFVHALMSGASLGAAVATASLCGAAACRAFGARAGMIDRAGLEALRIGPDKT